MTTVTASAPVLIMSHILHEWNLEEKRTLLKKAHDALPKGGALIVHEAIIDDDRSKNAFGLLMSLNMLIESPGGFDYSGADCRGGCRRRASGKPSLNTSPAPIRWLWDQVERPELTARLFASTDKGLSRARYDGYRY